MWEQAPVLNDIAHLPPKDETILLADALAIKENMARVRFDEAHHEPEECAFSATTLTDQDARLTRLNFNRQGPGGAHPTIGFRYVFEFKQKTSPRKVSCSLPQESDEEIYRKYII